MSEQSDPKLNVNSWFQEELHQTYLNDKKNVDESWKPIFEGNGNARLAASKAAVITTANGHPAPAPSLPLNPTDQLVPLRGVAAKIAENMTLSLTVPTATS